MQSTREATFAGEPYVVKFTKPAGESASMGAVLWGMGVGELRIARTLARLGVVSMQIRQAEFSNAVLDEGGIAQCREAIDMLESECRPDKIVLLGNCGFASLCFNTGLADSRVDGLILTNPHVSEMLWLSSSYKRKLTSLEHWWRVLRGRANIKHHVKNLHWMRMIVLGRLKGADEKALINKFTYKKDVTMPADLRGKFAELEARQVRTLLLFSQVDSSLGYFRRIFGSDLGRFAAFPGVTPEVLDTHVHLMMHKEDGAEHVTTSVRAWLAANFSADSATRAVPGLQGASTEGPEFTALRGESA